MKKITTILAIAICVNANAQIINTIAGTGPATFSGDGGPATSATIYGPAQVAVDAAGNKYIADFKNNRIRKMTISGIISTIAGTGAGAYNGDGSLATSADLNGPNEVEIDLAGNIYIGDGLNNVVRKINTSGVISTFAGNGAYGFSGDGGLATNATFANPYGTIIDAAGNVYISDYYNSRVRKVNTSGIVTTIVGNGTNGFGGDGGLATNAAIYYPAGLAIDASGNLFIADYYNSRIRKVNTSGIITTIAGIGTAGFSGDGGLATSAELNYPRGVDVDNAGNIYIADQNNNRIRMINTSGFISTIAGNGNPAFGGDGGLATNASVWNPIGITVDASGNLYISDYSNNRIRKVDAAVGINNLSNVEKMISIYPNPANNNFVIETNSIKKQTVNVFDATGKVVLSKIINSTTTIDISNLNEGVYNISIVADENVLNKKLVIVR